MSDEESLSGGDVLRGVYPVLHTPAQALGALGLLLLGAGLFVGAFATGSYNVQRGLGSLGLLAAAVGATWATTGRLQGLHSALADLNGAAHWIVFLATLGLPLAGAWRLGLLLRGVE